MRIPERYAVAVDGARIELTAEWLAGLLDGEACFAIASHGGHQLVPRVVVKLRDDDEPVLRALRAWLGGSLSRVRQSPTQRYYSPQMRDQITWATSGQNCSRVVALLDGAGGLRSKKARDYEVWKRAVRIFAENPGSRWSPEVVTARDHKLRLLKAELEAVRRYVGGNQLRLWSGPPPAVPFATVVADPPWSPVDQLPGPKRGSTKHYRCLPTPAICEAALPPLASDCWLFLWRLASMPEDALAVVRAWGFVPKSEIIWVKSKGERSLQMGMGRSVRNAHETCIVATRGRPERLSASVYSVLFAPRGKHSAKPEAFRDLVERLAPGPYLELFARTQRKGWDCRGDEL